MANTQYYNILPPKAEYKGQIGYIGFWPTEANLIDIDLIGIIKSHLEQQSKVATTNKLKSHRSSEIRISMAGYAKDVSKALLIQLMKMGSECLVGWFDNNKLNLYQISFETATISYDLIVTPVKLEPYSLKLDLFSRNTGILESDIMLNKKALFIGCGSVGSLVAVELAKAGVGHFMLVDNDIFGYHNICRHQCGIYDVGRYKTDAVADRILSINPYAEVKKYNRPIQDVDVDEVLEFCDENTVIVGGADNREGDLYACNLGIKAGASFVSIGCWERAFAGEIFYCLPEGTPTYADFLAVTGYVSGRVTNNRRFYTTEEDLEKASFEPGISADVNFVTIIGVKLILDLLNRNNEEYTQRLLPHLTQYTLVCNTNSTKIGGERAEIFSYPLQVTTSIVVPYAKKTKNEGEE